MYEFVPEFSEFNYITYEVHFHEMVQSVWCRHFRYGRCQLRCKIIIKLNDDGCYEMLKLVPDDSVLLDGWLVVDEELMAMIEGTLPGFPVKLT